MLNKGLLEDGRTRSILLSPSAHAIVMLDFLRYGLSIGRTFRYSHATEDLANEPIHVSFQSAETYPIIYFSILSRVYGAGTLKFVEAPTGGLVGGTAIAPVNRNRISSIVSGARNAYLGATAPTGGLTLTDEVIGAATANPLQGISGNILDENIWVLKQDTYYSIRLTGTGTSVRASLLLMGLEYTPRS